MKVGINGINIRGEKKKILKTLLELLDRKNISVYFSEILAKCFSKSKFPTYNKKMISKFDFIISFGGDGTLLNTVIQVGKTCTNILGVNVGKLGFLSYDIAHNFDTTLDEILNKRYMLYFSYLMNLILKNMQYKRH